MAALEAGSRAHGAEYPEAMYAVARLLASLETERSLSDLTREAASVAASATGRAAKAAAAIGTDMEWRRRMEEQMGEARETIRELEHRVAEMYKAMQEQEEWPAG